MGGSGCRDPRPGNGLRRALAAALAGAIVLSAAAAPAADKDQPVYLNEDAVIAAKEFHSFIVEGETVNVLLGEFSLTVGRRVVSGRDAVIWVTERRIGELTLRDIEVYVEGDKAKVQEPDGTTTTDRALYVVLRQKGTLRARVTSHGERTLASFPLYKRAVRMRKKLAAPGPAATQPGKPPDLVRLPAATRPVKAAAPRPKPPPKPKPPPPPTRHQPVSFRADQVVTEEVPDPDDPKARRRITIAKGNVYFSQGDPDQDLFAEMRADAAVLYTIPGADKVTPATAEKVHGVYLEGDVVMRRGDRTIRGERLFYDFTTGRAIILQPVFRTVQQQRNIPVYIRAREGRQLAAHEDTAGGARTRGYRWYFRDAIVTTSDFHTPSYHIGARRVYMEDTTPYDEKGVALDEQSWRSELTHTTFNLRGLPLLWTPRVVGDVREGHSALRKAQIGRTGRFGWGGETEWFLFRILGVPRPDGFKGRLDLDWYERGFIAGAKVEYERENYAGYALAYGMADRKSKDDFGTDREDVPANDSRGRFLWRHKQFLPRGWVAQGEISYLSDRNFLEEFFPGEFWTGKPQDTLIYVKKREANWAVTGLMKFRINDWITTTEAYPEVVARLIGQSLWQDRLTLHSEGRLGLMRYRPGRPAVAGAGSGSTIRADTRHEIDMPFSLGPVKVLPFAVGRLGYWEHDTGGDGETRAWGQVGFNALLHIWRIYNGASSRLWDVNRIKHIITPYGSVFAVATNVESRDLYPFNPDVEQYVSDRAGGTLGVRQLWQTKRGPEGNQHTVDWLRLDVSATVFSDEDDTLPADGRYFMYRPEHSLARHAINADLAWHVSDSTTFLADANFDVSSGEFGRINAGLVVVRDPRLRYYVGVRHIDAIDATVGTVGFSYKINRKYTVSLFEQYDFSLEGGQNLTTTATVLRKFPRVYLGFTVVYDRSQEDIGFVVTLWPEGITEATIGGRRLSLMLAAPED